MLGVYLKQRLRSVTVYFKLSYSRTPTWDCRNLPYACCNTGNKCTSKLIYKDQWLYHALNQTDRQTLLSHKDSCVETDTEWFIHIVDSQRDVTRKKGLYLNSVKK
jgi:hypothetical protein